MDLGPWDLYDQSMPRGADWLIRDTAPDDVFTPELLSDEHRLIEQTATEFMTNEVVPALPALEQKDWALARRLVARAGELGLVGVDTPEEYGGVGLDKAASIVVGEAVGVVGEFCDDVRRTDRARDHSAFFASARRTQSAKYLPRRQRRMAGRVLSQ